MRPRKIILLYASELHIPLLRLPLECAGFLVIGEHTPIGTLAAQADCDVDLVIYDAIGTNHMGVAARLEFQIDEN